MATRKERKRERRLKRFTKQLNEETKAYLKKIARQLKPYPYKDNAKLHCPSCHQSYENGFDGIIVFCRTCYYREGCLREIQEFETCRNCKRGW